MARAILVLLLLGLAQAGFCSEARQSAAVKEEAAEDPNTWDFGRVEEGKVFKHTFIFTNQAKKTVNIQGVHTSCGCTASEAAKKTLAPGESTQIKAQFKSKGYKGKVEQFVYVNTDDVDNPVNKFIIKADVVK